MMWTIYDHPRDFPRHVVVRAVAVGIGKAACACLYDTLAEAREDCARLASVPMPRDPDDDEVIVETWI
jgi:hypothetical protein